MIHRSFSLMISSGYMIRWRKFVGSFMKFFDLRKFWFTVNFDWVAILGID